VSRIEVVTNAYGKVAKTPLKEYSTFREGRRLQDNIKMDLRDISFDKMK
jgi:hypothetical protein